MRRFIPFLLLAIPLGATAQHAKTVPSHDTHPPVQAHYKRSELHTVPLAAFIDPKMVTSDWKIKVSHVARLHGSPSKRDIDRIKFEKSAIKQEGVGTEPYSVDAVTPSVGINFLGNEMFNGTPPDNTLAISNAGKIVSCDNATMEVHDAYAQDPYLSYWVNHYDFFGSHLSPAPTGNIYDPRVIYDSGSDRFIYCILHGSSSSLSQILLCFSKTNNPMDGWWVYRLTANAAHPNLWFDYPNLGVSNNEIYISGNMFTDGGTFGGNVLFQIPKQAGYSGESLNYQWWYDVHDGNNNQAFTLVPLSHGRQGNYGPGIYLAASEVGTTNDRILLFDLTDDASATNETLNVYPINTSSYVIGGYAAQSGSSGVLDVGDTRMQNGFYYNGTVHFVHTTDIGGGWNGIRYSRIKTSDQTITSGNFGNQGQLDYAYPSVAAFSTSTTDNAAMISFLASGPGTFPHVRVVNVDNGMNWSPSTLVKAGESHVSIQGGETERWGDYSGITRKHNASSPEVWMSGCYGASTNHWNVSQGFNAWISQIVSGAPASVREMGQGTDVKVFPNPVVDIFTLDFSVPERQQVSIQLTDIQGRVVKHLFTDHVKAGVNRLSFNRGALAAGQYVLTIISNGQSITNEKIVVQ
ncbi:MAG: T9SS type A sorting domain-containing protein [Flavobacteriales bacterium]|nr:T9SS type A sorting domain-containing protein [Flavobacteriales bacterium]